MEEERKLTNCTFSGLVMVEPRRPPPLLPFPSEAEAAENRLSSSVLSICTALREKKTHNVTSEDKRRGTEEREPRAKKQKQTQDKLDMERMKKK